MQQAFVEATNISGGFVTITEYDFDNLDNVDFNLEKYNSLIYFRVKLDFAHWSYIDMVKGWTGSDDGRKELIDICVKNIYGKTAEQLKEIGIDAIDVIYDMKHCDDECEGIFYYPFVCHCQLKGERRTIFIKELNK